MSKVYARGCQPANALTSGQRSAIWALASEQGTDRASFDLEFATICASGRSGRNYTYLDELIGVLQALGIHDYIIKPCYAATGGTWNCTNANTLANFNAADEAALVVAATDTLAHLVTLGVDISRCIFPLWNEWGRTQFGASSLGVGSSTQKSLFNAMLAGLRAAYPDIKIGTPVFSVVSATDYTWSDITVANCQSAGVLHPFMSSADYIVGNFYQGITGNIPLRGVGEVRKVTRWMHESFCSAIDDTVDVGGVLADKPIIYLESGLTYIASGQRLVASGVSYYHGGASYHADCVMAQLNQLRQYERVEHIGRYQLNNRSNALDSIDDADNYGDTLFNSGTIQRTELHLAMARHNGASEASIAALAAGTVVEPV